ncbi:MAG TPA: hypothetical protein VMY05_09035 [Acidobacteriota bacterium]|nr:hypothetical protein [Acidobacteriota bacterium]
MAYSAKHLWRVVSVTAAVLALSLPAAAQNSTSSQTPSEIAEAGYQAFKELDWETYASLMHPESLERFKSGIDQVLAVRAGDGSGSASNPFTAQFGAQASGEVIKATPAEKFFVNMMKGLLAKLPDMEKSLRAETSQVVGEVAEGDTLVHVVARTKSAPRENAREFMTVVSVRRSPDGWRMLQTAKIMDLNMVIRRLMVQ